MLIYWIACFLINIPPGTLIKTQASKQWPYWLFLEEIVQIPVGRPKDLEKRQRILSVAKALFLAHGYHASSMNQIAREAGVTKLTVYNHFQDKATLFSCAIEDTCEAILHEHPQLLQPSSDFAQEFYQACQRALNIRLPS